MKPYEIDKLVAEKVMGFEVTKDREIRQDRKIFRIPPYSRNIEFAWKVVEKLRENFWVQVESGKTNLCSIGEYGVVGSVVHGSDTAPLAICLAALKAVGVEVEVNG